MPYKISPLALFSFSLASKKLQKMIWKHQTHLCLTTNQLPKVIPNLVLPDQIRSLKIASEAGRMIIKGTSPDEATYRHLREILPSAKILRRLSVRPKRPLDANRSHAGPRYDYVALETFISMMSLVEAPLERLKWVISSQTSPKGPILLFRDFKFRKTLTHLSLHVGWQPESFEEAGLLGQIFPRIEKIHFPSPNFSASYMGGVVKEAPNLKELKFEASDSRLFTTWHSMASGASHEWNASTNDQKIEKSKAWLSEIFWRVKAAHMADLMTTSSGSLFEMALQLCLSTHPLSYMLMSPPQCQLKNGKHSALAAIILGPCGQLAPVLVNQVGTSDLIPFLKDIPKAAVNLRATTRQIFQTPTKSTLVFDVNPVQAAIVIHKPVILKLLLATDPKADLKQLAGHGINLFHLAICACTSDKALTATFKSLLDRKLEFGVFDSQLAEENAVGYTPLEMCLHSQRYESALFLTKSGVRLYPRSRRSLLAPATLVNATFNRPPPTNAEPVTDLLLQENHDRVPQQRLYDDFRDRGFQWSLLARIAAGNSTRLLEHFIERATQDQLDLALFDLYSHDQTAEPADTTPVSSKIQRPVSNEQLLLDAGADPGRFFEGRHIRYRGPANAFDMACRLGSVDRVELLMERYKYLITLRSEKAVFPVVYAARSDEMLQRKPELLERLADAPEIHQDASSIDNVLISLDVFFCTTAKGTPFQAPALKVRRNIKRMHTHKYGMRQLGESRWDL
jgi:hypothetical protein